MQPHLASLELYITMQTRARAAWADSGASDGRERADLADLAGIPARNERSREYRTDFYMFGGGPAPPGGRDRPGEGRNRDGGGGKHGVKGKEGEDEDGDQSSDEGIEKTGGGGRDRSDLSREYRTDFYVFGGGPDLSSQNRRQKPAKDSSKMAEDSHDDGTPPLKSPPAKEDCLGAPDSDSDWKLGLRGAPIEYKDGSHLARRRAAKDSDKHVNNKLPHKKGRKAKYEDNQVLI